METVFHPKRFGKILQFALPVIHTIEIRSRLLPNTFVTIKSGKSKGEIAFVYTSGTRSTRVAKVMTLSVPRIPVSMDASDLDDHDPPSPGPSSRASPAPSDSSTSSSSSSASRKRKRRVNESADTQRRTRRSITQTIHNERYQHGLLVKQFRVDQLQVIGTRAMDDNFYAGSEERHLRNE
ncbi:hypothetical protein K435DRAFT_869958 [Dendrothele bispora CBS 962.96]|uniref:Uncharacterized protein n=1 Tax=Dendrothele bispora (strain CBS 962.96) TaxID=1314807 RepID=A0A4S8L7R6_DENBC|nr:hypothetical protein K435DRAFT_869958 [Dendrothele bispora CBS 962.96]